MAMSNGVKTAIWTGGFVVLAAIITAVASMYNSSGSSIKVENANNTIIGNNNTINQSVKEENIYDANNGSDILDKYFNPRNNTTIYYPSNWETDRPPINGDGFSAKDPDGSGEILFNGSFIFKPGSTDTYLDEDWWDYYDQLKVEKGHNLLKKEESSFFMRSKGKKIAIFAARLIYTSTDRFYISKYTISEGRELRLTVSCAAKDKNRYNQIFNKIVNDVVIEEGGVDGYE